MKMTPRKPGSYDIGSRSDKQRGNAAGSADRRRGSDHGGPGASLRRKARVRAEYAVGGDRAGRAAVGGPLVGTPVETLSTEDDGDEDFVEIILIRRPDCVAEEGASFLLEDEDGTQATFIDNRNRIDADDDLGDPVNVQVRETGVGFRVKSDRPGNDIVPINERGSDRELDTGGLKIATSTGIVCEQEEEPEEEEPGNGEGQDEESGSVLSGAENGNCSGATVVETLSGTGDQQSARFGVAGSSFRVTSEVEVTERPILYSVTVNDENGDFVTSISQEREGTNSSFVNAGAGEYFLDIISLGVDYDITVEDCREEGIMNSPGGNLPKTGGVPLSILAGCAALLLVGVSLVRVATVGRGR